MCEFCAKMNKTRFFAQKNDKTRFLRMRTLKTVSSLAAFVCCDFFFCVFFSDHIFMVKCKLMRKYRKTRYVSTFVVINLWFI